MKVYDFDQTIYKGDSTRDFYFYCLKKHPQITLWLPIQAFFAVPFALHLIKKTYFKEKFYGFFRLIPDIDKTVEDFWKSHSSNIKDFYTEQKREDDLIISASPEFLLQPICDKLNVSLMASRVDKKTGKYSGLNCYGEEKVARFLEKHNEDEIDEFYSDSVSDYPLALLAKESFIVKGEKIAPWKGHKTKKKDNSNKKEFSISEKTSRILMLVLFALIIWFLLPVTSGIFHIGMIYPIIIFSIPLLMLNFKEWTRRLFNGKFKIPARIFSVLFCLGIVFILSVMVVMGAYSLKSPAEDKPHTVIVLGCGLNGDIPSRMLYARMNSALDYLNEHPETKCIASGGKGNGETITEAEAIFRYLISKGISADRIYLEDKSTSTCENITFSAKIIEENKLPENVAIASDNFHQLRVAIFAEDNGLSAYSIGNPTWIFLTAGYWAREVPAVMKAIILGN